METELIYAILVLAVVVEAVLSIVASVVKGTKIDWLVAVSLVVAIAVSIAYKLDILAAFGVVSAVPYIGNVLTGILVSRGSNYIADLVRLIQNVINGTK